MTGEPKFPTQENPFQKLESQTEVTEVIRPRIDTSEFEAQLSELETVEVDKHTKKSIDAVRELIDFLQTPMIIDSFANHTERYAWLNEVADEELLAMYHKNKLRGNYVNAIRPKILSFNIGFRDDDSVRAFTAAQANKVQAILDTHEDNLQPNTPELIEAIEEVIEETIIHMLELLQNKR